MNDLIIKNLANPYEIKKYENIESTIADQKLIIEYFSMMSGIDIPMIPMNGKLIKYKIVKAWWDRWHNKPMIENAVIHNWVTRKEADEIMSHDKS